MNYSPCQIIIPLDGLCYKKGYIIDSSILQEIFYVSQNVYRATEQKHIALRREKKNWSRIYVPKPAIRFKTMQL